MGLFIKFPDQSKSFTYWVEYGRLLEKMERGDAQITNNKFPVRIENVELLKSTCKSLGYIPIFGNEYKAYPGWIEFIAVKRLTTDN